MKRKFLKPIIVAHLFSFLQAAETNHFNFTKNVIEVEGDLNKDKLVDRAVVTQDTLDERAPYRLQVFFQQSTGQLKLIASSTQIIEPQYPNGQNGYSTGNSFSEVTIKNGVLSINAGLLRGYYEHKFRFQNGYFELIGFSMAYSDGRGVLATTDFNLSTGIRVEKEERYDTGKSLIKKRNKILIRPLPKLQDVIPMEKELY